MRGGPVVEWPPPEAELTIAPVDPVSFAIVAAAALGGALLFASLRPGAVVGHPRSALAVLFVITAAFSAVLVRFDPPGVRLEIDASTESLLPLGDASRGVYRDAVRDFGGDQVYVIAMETDDLFRTENLAALRDVTDRISRLEGVRSVSSLARVTYVRYEAANDWIEVRPFLEDIPEDPQALRTLRERALRDPVYRRTLVSDDGRTAALNVSFRRMTDGEFITADLDGQIGRILDDAARDGVRFHVSGRPHIKLAMYHAMTRDLAVLIPVALAIVAGVLASIAGTLRGVILPLGTVTAGVLWTFGAIALLGRPLTILTVLLAPTLVAVGSVYGLHVVTRYEEEAAGAPDPATAARRTLDHMILPTVIAGLTTVVGFGALLLTEVPAVFEIGAFSVFGIASIAVLSLTGVPAALALLPLRKTSDTRLRSADRVRTLLDAGLRSLSRGARAAPGRLIALWLLLTAISAAAIPSIAIDTDYLSFFDEDAPVRRDFATINRLLAGTVPLFVIIDGNERGYLRDPEVLAALERLQTAIDGLPGVSRTLSFLDTMRLLNRAISGDDPAEERLPETRPAISEILFLIPKSDLMRFATVDHSVANVVVRTGEVGSASVRALVQAIESVVDPSGFPGEVAVRVTGNAVLLNRAADGVARGQPLTVGLAALAIFALLSLGLRSVRLGLVAMIPNVVPVVIFFGVLGLGAAPLSLPTSLIGSVALGIAIDATAHFIVRYRDERRAGLSPDAAAAACGLAVGRPIAIASAMLILGFLSITFSDFGSLREFGALTALTMAVCLLTDLVLLPAILIRLRI